MDFSNILELDTVGNIKYRNNVVTGEVAVDNGNNTYDCYISGSDVAYPNIPTTFREPDFEVGESVEILIEYGNKEMPIIIGHAKKVVQEFVEDEINVLVTTLDAYTITDVSCYFEGRVEEIEGYENVIERGFHYGTSTDYGLPDVSSTGSFAAGCYNEQATGLDAETTYHYQAYVLDAYNDEHTGDDKTVTTTTTTFTNKIYAAWEDSSNDVWLLQYGTTGDLLNTWEIELTEPFYGNSMAVDINDNIYTVTGDNHSIKKRSSTGGLTLTKTETNYIYSIVAASDSFIYTYEYDSAFNSGYLSKRNTSDLVSIGTKTVDAAGWKTYYGMTVDSDGKIYMVNATDKRYETWDFIAGLEANSTGTIEYANASLATVGSNLVNLDVGAGGHGILLPKDYSDGGVGSDYAFADISRPYNMGTKENNYLMMGIESYQILIGQYNSSLAKVWTTVVSTGDYTVSVGIAAYPF